MKHVFLIKPSPDQSKSDSLTKNIARVMEGRDYEIFFSEYKDHVKEIVKNYPEKTRFYSVGGDGFFNQVIQNLVHTDHEVVCLPFGTGNDFSRAIHRHMSPEAILKATLDRPAIPIDTILVNDERYCVNVGCFGLDALIANTVHDVKTPKSAAYVASILRNISRYKFAKVKVMGKNGLLFNDQVTLCAFCNSRFYGGGFQISPKSKINDGLIDMVILPKVNRLFAPYYIYKILRKNLNSCKDVVVKQVKECVITTPATMNLDGEKKEAAKYHLVVQPKSLNLVI